MADEDTDTLDQEAQSFIDELVAGGFRYDSADRIQGFAGVDDEGVDEGDEAAETQDEDEGEGGADGETDEGDDSDEPGPEGDQGEPGDVGSDSGRAPSPLDGLSADEQTALLQLRNALMEHPELATEIGQKLDDIRSGRKPEPDPVDLPAYIDPDDEGQVAMWNRLQELEQRQGQTETRSEQAVVAQAQAEAKGNIDRAVERFAAAHPNLSADDIANIRNHTSANVNIPSVMANFPDDPIEGLTRSLEIGSMSDPLTRDKVLGVKSDTDKKDAKRKGNLDALSGSTGSAPRRPGRPKKIEGSQQQKWNEVSKRLVAEFEKLGGQ